MQSRKRTIARSSTIRRALVWAAQLMVFALSGVAAFSLRFDFGLPSDSLRRLSYALPIWIVLKVAVFRLVKLDRGVWEYVTIVDIVRLAIANLVASVLSCIAILIMAPGGFPRSIYVLDLLICFLGTAVIRVAVRILRNSLQSDRGDTPGR